VSAYSHDASGTHTFAQRLPAAYPAAYRYVSGGFAGFAVLAVLALIVAVVLLAQPSANRYFRPVPRAIPPWPPYLQRLWPPQAAPAGGPTPDQGARLSC
jgi:hypothetical protein